MTAITPDGSRAATATEDGHVTLWDVRNRKPIRSRHFHAGKPIHLAIRVQGDGVAIAYQDAAALIWWADEGTDRVIELDTRARLVAFAHQKPLLATVGADGYGDSWDSHTGAHVVGSGWTKEPLFGSLLTVLPSDRAAVCHGGNMLTNSRGFSLVDQAEIYPAGTTSFSHITLPPLHHRGNTVVVYDPDASRVTFSAIPRGGGSAQLEHGSRFTAAPACMFSSGYTRLGNGWVSAPSYTITYAYTAARSNNGIDEVLTGNESGDLIVFERSKPGVWLRYWVTWLVPPLAIMAIILWQYRLQQRKSIPEDTPTLAYAGRKLPISTRLAAWLLMIIGLLAIAGIIHGFFYGKIELNLLAFALPAGFYTLRRGAAWRVVGVLLCWVLLVIGAGFFGAVVFGQAPLYVNPTGSTTYPPIWTGALVTGGLTLLGGFLLLAMAHPDAKRVCAAVKLVRRSIHLDPWRALLLSCPDCGYDTRQTVADGLKACPECGRALDYTEEQQRWIVERLD